MPSIVIDRLDGFLNTGKQDQFSHVFTDKSFYQTFLVKIP